MVRERWQRTHQMCRSCSRSLCLSQLQQLPLPGLQTQTAQVSAVSCATERDRAAGHCWSRGCAGVCGWRVTVPAERERDCRDCDAAHHLPKLLPDGTLGIPVHRCRTRVQGVGVLRCPCSWRVLHTERPASRPRRGCTSPSDAPSFPCHICEEFLLYGLHACLGVRVLRRLPARCEW